MIRYPTSEPNLRRLIERAAPGWLERARLQTQNVESSRTGRFRPLWKEIGHVYQWVQNNKCGYCERQFHGTGEFDLEQFRPKRHYPLLAYHPLNLLLACRTCNLLKADRFPVEGEADGDLGDPRRGASERHLLIYPIGSVDADPEGLITFTGVLPRPRATRGHAKRRAEAVIEIFRLDRREDLLRQRAEQITNAWLVLRLLARDLPEDLRVQAEAARVQLTSSASPHASCVRRFLHLHQRDPGAAERMAQQVLEYLQSEREAARSFIVLPQPAVGYRDGADVPNPVGELARELLSRIGGSAALRPTDVDPLKDLLEALQHTLAFTLPGASQVKTGAAAGQQEAGKLDTQSKEQILIGQMLELCGRAGQIFRPISMFDYGIDGEIEFKHPGGSASGSRAYVQLKSGHSYLRFRKRDQKLVFDIPKKRHVSYWLAQRYDVYLVTRDGAGVLRWMNVSAYLRNRRDKASMQVEFDGELLDVAAILRVRDLALAQGAS